VAIWPWQDFSMAWPWISNHAGEKCLIQLSIHGGFNGTSINTYGKLVGYTPKIMGYFSQYWGCYDCLFHEPVWIWDIHETTWRIWGNGRMEYGSWAG
jgi:hypothetical protein